LDARKRDRRIGRSRLTPAGQARPGEAGQAMVEFVLVLPVLLLILFGIAQFGLALNSANDETHVANLVARYATVDENPATGGKSLQTWGKEQLDQNALKNGAKVCISFPSGEETGQPVLVEVTSKVSPLNVFKLFPAVNKVLATDVNGKAYMRLEAPPTAAVYKAGCA
jgi:Flp pilus assembly protein TadG